MDRPPSRGRGRPRLTPPPTPSGANPSAGGAMPPRPGMGLQPPPPANPSLLPPMYAPPPAAAAAPGLPPSTAATSGMAQPLRPPSGPQSNSFANDVLSRLPGPQRLEMINLVSRFKQRQIPIQTFLSLSRTLLGEELYGILARGMSRQQAPPPPNAPPKLPGAMAPTSLQRPLGHRVVAEGGEMLAPSAATMAGVDAAQIDTASLQDVMQYAGVDLKAEADLIVAEQSLYLEQHQFAAPTGSSDARLRPEHWFNLNRLRAIVQAAASSRGVTEVSEEAICLLGMALHRRLAGVLADLACITQHRVDGGRMSFKMRIENDPRKQLWLLEQLKAEQAEQGTQIEQLLGLPPATLSAPSQSAAGGGGVAGQAKSAQAKKAEQTAAAAGAKKVTEDAMIKTRLSNITALNALGVKQKSWMTGGGGSGSGGGVSSAASTAMATDGDESADAVRIPLHFSQAPSITPMNDRELALTWQSRAIGLTDLIWYAEHDPHLYRSPLMLYLYSSMVPSQPPPQ